MNKLELNMASTGQGSTFALINSVVEAVGKKVLFISLELNKENVTQRIAIASEIKGVALEDIDITIVECPMGTWDEDKISKVAENMRALVSFYKGKED